MKAAGGVLCISKFIDYYADDLLRQNVVLICPRLFTLQIEPAKQLLFLGSEFDEAHAVAAVAAVAPLVGAQRIPHALCVQFDRALRQRGLQFVHVLE